MANIDIKPGGPGQATGADSTATIAAPDPAIFKPGKYTFSLVVSDGLSDSEVATTVVEVRARPVAKITGKTPVGLGQAITLSGKDSTPGSADAPITTYTWTVKGPE
jgi:hypothetical protein